MKQTTRKLIGSSWRSPSRRGMLKTLGAAAAATFWADEQLEAWQSRVNTNSKPSDLKITDMRVATVVGAPMRCPIIRIDTNQGIYGLGEVRDGASKNYALMLKSRLLGENPATSTRFSARSNSSAVTRGRAAASAASRWRCGTWPAKPTTCPCTRCLAASSATSPLLCRHHRVRRSEGLRRAAEEAQADKGFTWLKMDLGVDLVENKPGHADDAARDEPAAMSATRSTCSPVSN